MRRLFVLLMLLAPALAFADVRFVSPVDGSQAVGRTLLEIATTTPNVNRVEFRVDGNLVAVARTAPYRAVADFGSELEAHVVSAAVYSNGFKTVERTEVKTSGLNASDEMKVDLVELPLKISGSSRISMSDLDIRENGARQKLLELRNSRGATSFVFVVDRSLSMSGGRLDAALIAIDAFRERLRKDDDVSLILFNHRVERSIALERGVRAATQLRSTKTNGGTALRDALIAIKSERRTVTIVISDGSDRNSVASEEDAIRAMSRSNVSLYALLLDDGNASRTLGAIATRSGGDVIRSSPRDLRADLSGLLDRLDSRYVAVYQSTNHDDGWRKIEVRPTRKGVQVATSRKGYYSR